MELGSGFCIMKRSIVALPLITSCIDAPYEPAPPPAVARVVASWDPLACGEPAARVALELEDEAGARLARSVPCALGGITLDVAHYGVYFGTPGAARLIVDEPMVYWQVSVPP
jgi:hypothetical protein